jgi:hypothetical protein
MGFADEVQPAGAQYLGLVDALIDLFESREATDVEVVFINYKIDTTGEKIMEDDHYVVAIRPILIQAINAEVREELRKQYELVPLMSLMVLWLRRNVDKEGKLGVLSFKRVARGKGKPGNEDYDPWEMEAISLYLHRRCPDELTR